MKPGHWVVAGLGVILLGLILGGRFAARMDGPWGMIPGGRFATGGPDLPCRKLSALDLADVVEVEVEVRAPEPRTITTWNVVVDGSVYIPADFLTPLKRWPHQLVADPRLRIRALGQIYHCQAARVTRAEQIEVLRHAIAAKYAIEPDGWASRTEVWWFELRPVSNGSDIVFRARHR
jgi:hypothetical protein